jgi:hypothetical protein
MYNIDYEKHEDVGVLEAEVSGDLDFESAIEISSQTREKALSLNFDLVKDVREMNLKTGIMDVMDFFKSNKNRKLNIKHKTVTTAMVVSPKNYDFYKFWETVASNNGMISKVYLNKEKAFAWLQNKTEEKQK